MVLNARFCVPQNRYENERKSEIEGLRVSDKLKIQLINEAKDLLCDGDWHGVRFETFNPIYYEELNAWRYEARLTID